MSIAERAPASRLAEPAATKQNWFSKNWGLLAAAAVLIAILLAPTPAGLTIAGHRMLAVLAFAVIAFGVNKKGASASMLMITTTQTASIWNVGIKTAPAQNMVAYGTETFEAHDFVRAGLVLTVIAFVLVMALGVTYWRWLGYA